MAQIVCKNLAVGYGNTVVKSNINYENNFRVAKRT